MLAVSSRKVGSGEGRREGRVIKEDFQNGH